MFTLLQEAAKKVAAEVTDAAAGAGAGTTEGTNVVADATTTAAQGGSSWSFWIMIIAMIAIMYFFMWRPESKRRKEAQKFRDGLKAGDKVITAGGIYAVVKKVEETSLLIEVDSNVTLRIDKGMVVAAPQTPENK